MPMTFTFRENFENFDDFSMDSRNSPAFLPGSVKNDDVQIFAEKLIVPQLGDHYSRPRLERLLKRSLDQVGAVLITGRTGTGKTALAANFTRNYERKVWYRVEAADVEWNIFSRYLAKGLGKNQPTEGMSVREFIEKLLSAPASPESTPRLIVLDDIHRVFDADWFAEFFSAILQSVSPMVHLVFLSRSKPSFPLWRLRSKQVLTVIDEKIIAFDTAEASAVCEKAGLAPGESSRIFAESFGRIGKLKSLIEAI
jgi:ATP/maltotriose-dependent transcriptional regulator MalT